jgi:hypothetical protein
VEFASRYDACEKFHSSDLSTLAKDKEGHIVDDCSASEREMNEECRKGMNADSNKRTLCFTSTCSKTYAVETHHHDRDWTQDKY